MKICEVAVALKMAVLCRFFCHAYAVCCEDEIIMPMLLLCRYYCINDAISVTILL